MGTGLLEKDFLSLLFKKTRLVTQNIPKTEETSAKKLRDKTGTSFAESIELKKIANVMANNYKLNDVRAH